MIGKIFRKFSSEWKKSFQWVENFAGRGRRVDGEFPAAHGQPQGGAPDDFPACYSASTWTSAGST